ncbi:MAG TPA: MFS transporter [Rhizomicrobium sp.]|nr:MFS transporter [Rhizomicrobium sp.]
MPGSIRPIFSILLSTLIFLIGNGLLGTLIPVRADLAGFSHYIIGVIGSAYFAGFVAGCFLGPRMIARAGHSRTFAVAAGIAAATALMQSMSLNETVWIVTRAAFGVGAACLYMVIESWLNDSATNVTRGRIFSAYITVNLSGLVIGQALFMSNGASSFTLFNIAAIFYALCLIPVGLTRQPQPRAVEVPRLRPMRLFKVSPVGMAGCVAVGCANAAVWTFAPIYGESMGLHRGWLSLFMIAFTLGGAVVQVPLGRLSDHLDRRYIIAGIGVFAASAAVLLYLFGHHDAHNHWRVLGLIALFGMTCLPLYGMSVAQVNDRLPRSDFVEASASLLLVNSVASILGPPIAASVIQQFGISALFLYTASIHAVLAIYTISRIATQAPAPKALHDAFVPVPEQASPLVVELDPRSGEEPEKPQAAA